MSGITKTLDSHPMSKDEMRTAYVNALIRAAREDDKVVSVNCDLSSSTGTVPFANEFPGRSFNVGIAEANGCGVAAGLSAVGFIPFYHSFAVFSSRRICDQVFQSCAYAGLNVKIMGCDAGVSATYNGGTHMSFEDVGVLRSIPEITIVEPSDTVMMGALVPLIKEIYGVVYMRSPRKQIPDVYPAGASFALGKAALLREGADVALIASGMTVVNALAAADMLAADGIGARVVDMFTIKPIDRACVVECAECTGAIVTAENHNIIGGLGSAVAEVLAEERPTPMSRVGIRDSFGEVGTQDYLMEKFGLTPEEIYRKAKEVIKRKKA
ncbi:MAG: transketolase family protein [Clostridiales bacterium]|nr:transketolase family protein [Clostridiales bacterium]